MIDAEILESMTMSRKSKLKKPVVEPLVPDASARGIGSSGDSFDWRTFEPAMLEGGAKAPLATELVTYRDRLDELLQHEGEYVVIKGELLMPTLLLKIEMAWLGPRRSLFLSY